MSNFSSVSFVFCATKEYTTLQAFPNFPSVKSAFQCILKLTCFSEALTFSSSPRKVKLVSPHFSSFVTKL